MGHRKTIMRAHMPAQQATVWLVAGCVAAAGCSLPPRTAADLLVTHARVWTGDAVQPDARSLAIIGDRLVSVGGEDDVERWRGTETRVIDAGGRRVVPGFNDAHVHFV